MVPPSKTLAILGFALAGCVSTTHGQDADCATYNQNQCTSDAACSFDWMLNTCVPFFCEDWPYYQYHIPEPWQSEPALRDMTRSHRSRRGCAASPMATGWDASDDGGGGDGHARGEGQHLSSVRMHANPRPPAHRVPDRRRRIATVLPIGLQGHVELRPVRSCTSPSPPSPPYDPLQAALCTTRRSAMPRTAASE